MDIDKVRELTDSELETELGTQRRHLYDLRFQLATRQLTDHSQLAQTRRSIARILTVMTERDLEPIEAVANAPPAGAAARRSPRSSAAAKPAAKKLPLPRPEEVSHDRRANPRERQGEGRARRVRQDGQDDRRLGRAPVSATRCTSASSA